MKLPTGQYGAIYADPPWRFKTFSAKGRDRCPDGYSKDGNIKHYFTMSLADIEALPVGDLAADDCALFLWATDPLLPEAIKLGGTWGFTYKTVAFYWAKTSGDKFPIGTGYWTRSNPEQCLLFTKGKPKRLSASVRKLVLSERREHSRKPDEITDYIEQLVAGPYLELFSRTTKPGWHVWGNETDKFKVAA